jgi:hypothetical protein
MQVAVVLPLVVAALLLGPVAHAEPPTFDCPQSVAVKESPSGRASGGWRFVPGPAERQHANLDVFDGHPSERASLKPDREPARSTQWTATWLFPRGTTNTWLGCRYRGTEAMLARRLPDGLVRCTATYREIGSTVEATGRLVCDRGS